MSADELLNQYVEFTIEGWPSTISKDAGIEINEEEFLSVNLHSPQYQTVVDTDGCPDEQGFPLEAIKRDHFDFADDFVENTRGQHSEYDLYCRIPNASLRRAGGAVVTSPDSRDPVKEFKQALNEHGVAAKNLDIIFDAEDHEELEHDDMGPVVIVDPAGVTGQFARLALEEPKVRAAESSTKTKSSSFLGQLSPSFPLLRGFGELPDFFEIEKSNPFENLCESPPPYTESKLKSTARISESCETTIVHRKTKEPRRTTDPEFQNALDVEMWSDETRDTIIEAFDGLRLMSMGQSLPPNSKPNPALTVVSGAQSPFLGTSALLSRRYKKWITDQN